MQTRAEYQRARRAALAVQENQNTSAVVTPDVATSTSTFVFDTTTLKAITAKTITTLDDKAAVLAQVPQVAQATKYARQHRTGLKHATSIAAVAAIVLTALAGGPSSATEVEFLAETIAVEADAVVVDALIGDLLVARDGAASRAATRIDITEILGADLDLADPEAVAAATEVLVNAELMLIRGSQASPELIEEFQIAVEELREAIQLLAASENNDAANVAEPEGLSRVAPGVAAFDAAIAPVETPFSQPEFEAEPDSLQIPVSDEQFTVDPIDLINSRAERVYNLGAEAELPIPVVEPRPLTAAEAISVLAAEAQADGARLHEAYAYSLAGQSNGRIPESMMQTLSWNSAQMLRPDAAAQMERLNQAFRLEFGIDLPITSTYRSFAGQVQARARSGLWAATPGTSNHGWAIAVDFTGGINRFGTPQHIWMQENAPAFGWIHPEWARRGGRLPEPWHWEFWGTPDPVTGEPISPGILRGTETNQPGEFVPSDSIWHP